MNYKFIHAADLHLDTPFSGIGRVSPRVAEALQNASLDAFDALIDLTLREEARFLLIAGDLYDGTQRGIRAQRRFERGLERLSERGIATFIVHGNHDPLGGSWSAIRNWPAGVTVFGDESVEMVQVTMDGQVIANIHGISYPTSRVDENLALRYGRSVAPGLHIGLLHCNVEGNDEHAAYSPCSLSDLACAGLDYWALGHVHKRQTLSRAPWVVYPGNLQGLSQKPSEQGPKGALVIEVRDGQVQEPRFEALDRIRFASLKVDLSGIPDVAGLQRRLMEEAERLLAAQGDRGLILRASLVGRGEVYSEVREAARLEAILAELRSEGERSGSLLWWEDLRNEASPPLDIEGIRRRGDFSAELLRLNAEREADPGAARQFLKECFSPLDRFKAYMDDTPEAELAALVREAEVLALDLLEQE